VKRGTTYHICFDIEGALRQHGNRLNGALSENGRNMSGSEVKAFLRKARDERGFKYYSGCSNMNSDGRCAGHASGSEE
jgi:hypothetical protein